MKSPFKGSVPFLGSTKYFNSTKWDFKFLKKYFKKAITILLDLLDCKHVYVMYIFCLLNLIYIGYLFVECLKPYISILKPTGYVMHQQFNIQQL